MFQFNVAVVILNYWVLREQYFVREKRLFNWMASWWGDGLTMFLMFNMKPNKYKKPFDSRLRNATTAILIISVNINGFWLMWCVEIRPRALLDCIWLRKGCADGGLAQLLHVWTCDHGYSVFQTTCHFYSHKYVKYWMLIRVGWVCR